MQTNESPSREQRAAPRSFVRAAGATLGFLVLILAVMEVTCRVEDWVMYRTPILSRATSIGDLVIRDAAGMHGRPNVSFQRWTMNGLGMRGPEASVVVPSNTIRVITAGASETFGQRESANQEYPRQLEDSLRAQTQRGACGANAPQFEVLNAAFAGMSMPTIEQDVRTRLSRLHPDFVVIYPSPVQYVDDDPPVAAARDSAPHRPPAPDGSLRLRVFTRLRDQFKLLVPQWLQTMIRASGLAAEVRAHPASWRFETVPSERLTQYESDLRKLIGSVRAIGAVPVLTTHANVFMGQPVPNSDLLVTWQKFYPRATGPVLIAFDSLARQVTLRVGADSGVVTIDAAQAMASAPRSAFVDFVHFSDHGAARIATLLTGGVLDAARASGKCAGGAPR
jgi:hypothetical protein